LASANQRTRVLKGMCSEAWRLWVKKCGLVLELPGLTWQDDGVVTSMVTGADGKGFLLVLDASSFEEIARATLPYGLPYGFHNQYFPA